MILTAVSNNCCGHCISKWSCDNQSETSTIFMYKWWIM